MVTKRGRGCSVVFSLLSRDAQYCTRHVEGHVPQVCVNTRTLISVP